jgi:hypothetical protein
MNLPSPALASTSSPRTCVLCAVHRSAHPGHQSALGAIRAVGRTIKSSFTTASAKRSNTGDADADADDDTPAKRRGGVPSVTPSTYAVTAPRPRRSTLTLSSSTSRSLDDTVPVVGGDDYFSYSPNEGLVPGHPSLRPSVLQPFYRRLPPEVIVRLSAGDELIIVVPTDSSTRSGDATARARVVDFYSRAFAAVSRRSLSRTEPNSVLVEDIILKRHRLRRDDKWFLEYPVRVRNYAERDNFSRLYMDRSPVDHSWSQGAGINLSVVDIR